MNCFSVVLMAGSGLSITPFPKSDFLETSQSCPGLYLCCSVPVECSSDYVSPVMEHACIPSFTLPSNIHLTPITHPSQCSGQNHKPNNPCRSKVMQTGDQNLLSLSSWALRPHFTVTFQVVSISSPLHGKFLSSWKVGIKALPPLPPAQSPTQCQLDTWSLSSELVIQDTSLQLHKLQTVILPGL